MLIDALQCGFYDRAVFEELRRGGFTCVTPTLGFWEGTLESLDALGQWRDLASECADVVLIARSTADILSAHQSNRVALLLGFQNSNCLEGRIRFVELFAELGVRVMQLTYNNQNELGGSCYEDVDGGLSRFGREVVREMNRTGVLIDLSHVGEKTTLETIECSQKPVAVTHANAASLFPHRRNKSDAVIKALSQKGGIIGCVTYRNITPAAACDSIESWCEMVARTVDIAGIDHVGIGTDLIHKGDRAYLDWMRMGRWSRTVNYGAGSAATADPVTDPRWLTRPSDLGKVRGGLKRVGFSKEECEKITAANWLRVYREVFG
ncbi:MAG: dipeptidase [Hyphomicrobiales bacterium]|nr:dipeptidase [Hyphomicrobiales bacterium]